MAIRPVRGTRLNARRSARGEKNSSNTGKTVNANSHTQDADQQMNISKAQKKVFNDFMKETKSFFINKAFYFSEFYKSYQEFHTRSVPGLLSIARNNIKRVLLDYCQKNNFKFASTRDKGRIMYHVFDFDREPATKK